MNKIGLFVESYGGALKARSAYNLAMEELIASAKECRAERDALTLRLASERSDLVRGLQEAYNYAQPLTDAMMSGGRWPDVKEKRGTRYLDTLEAIPMEHRTPEMNRCLDGWKRYAEALAEIERAYPAPPHFWWNGAELSGPNLYADFKLTMIVHPSGDEYRPAS